MRIYKIFCKETVYRAAEGDTWQSVADKFETLAENVAKANGNGELSAGDLVFVPDLDCTLYVAQPLDTIGAVAKKFGVDPKDILPADAENVYVGQKLLIKVKNEK